MTDRHIAVKQPKLHHNQSGFAIVEFAILLPVFMVLAFAVISFGYAYVVYEAEGRVVSAAAKAMDVAVPPSTNEASWSPISWTEAASFGGPLIPFTVPDPKTGPPPGASTICAQSYATLDEAQAALNSPKPCDKDTWDAKPPATGWTSGTPWYVVVQAKVMPSLPIPDLYSWMVKLPLTQTALASVNASTTSSASSGWVTADFNTSTWSGYLVGTTPDAFCQSNGYSRATGNCMIKTQGWGYSSLEAPAIAYGVLAVGSMATGTSPTQCLIGYNGTNFPRYPGNYGPELGSADNLPYYSGLGTTPPAVQILCIK